MNRTRILLLLIIVILAVVAVVAFVIPALTRQPAQPAQQVDSGGGQQVVVQPQETPLPTATPILFVDVVIAVQELARGTIIPPNAVALRPFPEQSVPFNAVTDLEDVIGKTARTDIFREEPLLSTMVVDNFTSLARVGSDAAAILPSGLRAIPVPIDRLTSVAYGVQDGDRVDVIISLLFVGIDEEFQSIVPNQVTLYTQAEDGTIQLLDAIEGRLDSTALGPVIVGPSERQRPRLVTQMTIQDALVVHVGNFPADGRFIGVPPTPTPVPFDPNDPNQVQTTPQPTPTPERPDIITLGVSPQEAVIIAYLIESRIPLTLALRPVNDTSRNPTSEVSLDYIMTTYGIELPARQPFSIEPAIRSIRQLSISDTVSLSNSGIPAGGGAGGG
jgi:Flp pilus assembly protein CpaB